MASIKIDGKIIKKFPIEKKSETFSVQRFWVQEMTDQYPNTYEIQSIGKTLGVMDSYWEGDLVNIDANLNGRFHSGAKGEMVFNSISLWKIAKQPTQPAASQQPAYATTPATSNGQAEDLPF